MAVLSVAASGVSVFYLTGPVAVDDSYVLRGTPASVKSPGVLANDVRLPYGTTAILVSGPEHGSVTLSPDGTWTYDPGEGTTGWDEFRYTLSVPLRNTATVTLVVTAPIAQTP